MYVDYAIITNERVQRYMHGQHTGLNILTLLQYHNLMQHTILKRMRHSRHEQALMCCHVIGSSRSETKKNSKSPAPHLEVLHRHLPVLCRQSLTSTGGQGFPNACTRYNPSEHWVLARVNRARVKSRSRNGHPRHKRL